jgi:hypothetical protein
VSVCESSSAMAMVICALGSVGYLTGMRTGGTVWIRYWRNRPFLDVSHHDIPRDGLYPVANPMQ